MNKLFTLCIIQKDEQVLLGMKKRGFGAGRWNGFGGKVTPGETIEEAAVRETKEEAGIDVQNLEKVGILEFTFLGSEDILQVHIFKTSEFIGEPTEGEEMKPQWFETGVIPYDSMWPDDIFWLPLLFAGKKFKGGFSFGPDDTILKQELIEVESL